jgi:hypothetical protein
MLVPAEQITEELTKERNLIFIAENKDCKKDKTSSLTPLKRITLILESHQRQELYYNLPTQTNILR